MPNYKKMYLLLTDVVTDTIAALVRAQLLAEEETMNSPEDLEEVKPETSE